ncbi:RNA polymerase sigma factor [Kitasatospora fiedleri]|uniref:RNA polymerase sigma factor n=1 Tax=Kitasatospora fiedleri TaxID=2991545 RepID=UPI00249A6069|nr:sigma-70 family RNA polymerase sigma factor [Kitasatospora fiedleri]
MDTDDTGSRRTDGGSVFGNGRPVAAEAARAARLRGEFLDFIDHAHPRMIRLLMLHGVGRQDAEDAAQEAVLQAWREVLAGRWESIVSPLAWLRRVTWSVHLRPPDRKRVQPLIALGVELPETPAAGPGHAELTDQIVTVLAALSALPVLPRAVMALTLDGATDSEIADLLDTTTQKVRDLRKQGRTGLRHLIPHPGSAKEDAR